MKLQPFKPINVKMLMSLVDIYNDIGSPMDLEYQDDCDVDKDEIVQLCMNPDGVVSLGSFNDSGSGMAYFYDCFGNNPDGKLILDRHIEIV